MSILNVKIGVLTREGDEKILSIPVVIRDDQLIRYMELTYNNLAIMRRPLSNHGGKSPYHTICRKDSDEIDTCEL